MSDTAVKILVVDDEQDVEMLIRQKFRKQIKENKYSFLFACDGLQALEAIRRDPQIDIVMTDINMPVMDGLALTRELRKDKALKDVPVVLLTGDKSAELERQGRAAGANEFLTKPLQAAELQAAVRRWLEDPA